MADLGNSIVRGIFRVIGTIKTRFIEASDNITIAGNNVWHEGNDGSGIINFIT
jgi:hypothetical protein